MDAQDVAWVRQAVNNLLATGAAKPWAEARQELEAKGISAGNLPFFVMPIGALEKSSSTPLDRKLRLIHDCRPINAFLDLSAFVFELE